MTTKRFFSLFFLKSFFVLICCFIIAPIQVSYAQGTENDDVEVYLAFRHRGVINSVVVSYYRDDQFYLPVNEIFNLFKIEANIDGLVTSGRFTSQQIPYKVDLENQFIEFNGKRTPLDQSEFIIDDFDNYILVDFFKNIFGLEFKINFNNLTLDLTTQYSLPIIEQAFREQKRRIANANRSIGKTEYYPLLKGRERTFIDGGFMDYSLSAYQNTSQTVYSFSNALGLQLLGGDLQGSIFGSYSSKYTNLGSNNLRWRYVIQDTPWITNITLGQSSLDGIMMNAYRGIRISNDPVEPKRLFDEYEIQGTTLPESEVELYMNNALVDFKMADETGQYRFLSPMYYGSSQMNLRIYGPNGQLIERSSRIQIPFTFMQKGQVNYKLNAGVLENPIFGSYERDLVFQGNTAYGLTNWLTTKVGIESFENNSTTLNGSLSARLSTNYIMTFEAVQKAYLRTSLNAIYANSASINLDYTDYTSSQNLYNTSGNDRQVVASVFYPFRFFSLPLTIRVSGFTRFREDANFSTFRLNLGTRINRVNLRLGFNNRVIDTYNPFQFTPLSTMDATATYSIPRSRDISKLLRGTYLRGQARFIPFENKFESAEVLISKGIFNSGRVQLTFGRNFAGQYNSIRFNVVFDFKKTRSNTTITTLRDDYTATQNLRGSIGYDSNFGNFLVSSRNQVGRSATAVRLYVDNDNDNKFSDQDQPINEGALQISRSGSPKIIKNGVLYYTMMQPYYHYNIELNKGSISNPMLVPELEKFSIITDPNTFKKIEIPFYMSGLFEGMVERVFLTGKKAGIGGLKLTYKGIDNDIVKEIRTFSDGGFYDYEIPPGKYELYIDSEQLSILNSRSNPEKIEFEIQAIAEGDFVEGLHFELIPLEFQDEEGDNDEEITEPSSETSKSSIPGVGVSETTNAGGGISIEYSLPVVELEKNKCRYGFQLGAYSSLAKANEAADALPVDSYIIYNSARQLYALRSGLYQSLASTAQSMKEINKSTSNDAAVLNQCYGTVASNYIPGSNLYHLQFGAFSNRIRANLFSKQINEQFGLKSFVAQDEKDMLYKVRLGPFETKGEANTERSDMLSNTSIRQLYISESEGGARMINVDFEYMLQLGEFSDKEKALLYAIRIESEFDIKSKIVIDENDSVVLFANKTFINWNEILDLKNKISEDATFEKPILHLYEKKIEEVSMLERPSDELRKPFIEIVREN